MVSPRLIVFFACLILSVAFALIMGGKPERAGALVVLAMTALQFALLSLLPRSYAYVDLASVVVDLVGLVGFSAIAIFAVRVWPIWAASLQLLSLTSHFARETDSAVPPLVYIAMKSGPTFLVLLVLFLGTLSHVRRVRRGRLIADWKTW